MNESKKYVSKETIIKCPECDGTVYGKNGNPVKDVCQNCFEYGHVVVCCGEPMTIGEEKLECKKCGHYATAEKARNPFILNRQSKEFYKKNIHKNIQKMKKRWDELFDETTIKRRACENCEHYIQVLDTIKKERSCGFNLTTASDKIKVKLNKMATDIAKKYINEIVEVEFPEHCKLREDAFLLKEVGEAKYSDVFGNISKEERERRIEERKAFQKKIDIENGEL